MRRCPVQLLHDAEMPHVSIPCPWDIPRPRDLMEYNIQASHGGILVVTPRHNITSPCQDYCCIIPSCPSQDNHHPLSSQYPPSLPTDG